jgi:hypothetical protein
MEFSFCLVIVTHLDYATEAQESDDLCLQELSVEATGG